jgi:NAD(P)-dependent dehydrogenase (short-subunit alcohol dehydrogenase family)
MSEAPVTLVTGASRGLGRALAEEAGARGHHVIAVARTVGGLEELDDTIKASGGQATLVPLDLTDIPALDRLGEAIAGRWGRLDLWLHCAVHAAPLSPTPMIDTKELGRSIDLNIRATSGLIGATDRLLRTAPAGRAVLMDDDHTGESFFATYDATKAAARALWLAWGTETRKSAFRAVLARPPAMPTATRGRFFPGENRDALTHPRLVAPRLLDAVASVDAPGAVIDLRQSCNGT